MMPHSAGRGLLAWIKLAVETQVELEATGEAARVHNVFRVARTVVGRSGICPVCGLFFHTRQRVIHHIEHSCESCKAAVQAGLVRILPEAQMKEVDAEDAKERREARKQGVSYLALRGEE